MFKKVTPGEAIQIKAQEWNAMLEAAEAEINRRGGQTSWSLKSTVPAGCAWAINQTGRQLTVGAIVIVTGFSFVPFGLSEEPVLNVALPMTDDARHLAVAIEDCPLDAVFRVRLQGLALVHMAAAPLAGQDYFGIGEDGMPVAVEIGMDRIIAHITDSQATIALVLLGCGSAGNPLARGMFQLVDVSASVGISTVRVCDGAMPTSAIAGIANINNQSYSCPIAEFQLTSTPQYFYLKFTAPSVQDNEETGETAPMPATCEIVAFTDDAAVVSTDTVVYRLIGHAWTETPESSDGEEPPSPVVKIVQDHPVGNLVINWFGPCLNLLSGVTD